MVQFHDYCLYYHYFSFILLSQKFLYLPPSSECHMMLARDSFYQLMFLEGVKNQREATARTDRMTLIRLYCYYYRSKIVPSSRTTQKSRQATKVGRRAFQNKVRREQMKCRQKSMCTTNAVPVDKNESSGVRYVDVTQ